MATIGSFLSGLQRRVEASIEFASFRKVDGMTPFELSGARALGIAVENTRNYLNDIDCLEKSQDKVDTFAQSKLNELESYVEALEQKTPPLLTMEKLADDYISSLFFATFSLPKLETIEPKQLDLSQKSQIVEVRFLGNFGSASHRYPPTLQFNHVIFKAFQMDRHCLHFSIDVNRVNPAGTVFISGLLTVPRKIGWCCGPLVKTQFKVWIGNFTEIPKVDLKNFSYTTPSTQYSSGSEEGSLDLII